MQNEGKSRKYIPEILAEFLEFFNIFIKIPTLNITIKL